MKHIDKTSIIITLSILILSCSHKQRTDVSQKEANLYSLTTYRNIYNKYGKLETVFADEKSFSIVGSSSSLETHFIYKNDTVLLREEEFEILPDGSKVLTSQSIFDENLVKYIRFSNRDTVVQVNYVYENGNILSSRRIDVREYCKENTETTYNYDSENRVSRIIIVDDNNGITTIETYKYDMVGDTLITYFYVDNVLNRTEKKVEKDNYSIELFYNEQNSLVRSTEITQIDSENNLSVCIDYEYNIRDSTFYHLDKKVKAIWTELERDSTIISIDEIDKSKRYSLGELLDIFAGPLNKTTFLFEYDEFGNLTREAEYNEGDVEK